MDKDGDANMDMDMDEDKDVDVDEDEDEDEVMNEDEEVDVDNNGSPPNHSAQNHWNVPRGLENLGCHAHPRPKVQTVGDNI